MSELLRPSAISNPESQPTACREYQFLKQEYESALRETALYGSRVRLRFNRQLDMKVRRKPYPPPPGIASLVIDQASAGGVPCIQNVLLTLKQSNASRFRFYRGIVQREL
jgi:hypothetical protein